MSLRPIVYHLFSKPLPYLPALALQEKIHAIQVRSREPGKEYSSSSLSGTRHPDTLLLLEHRPVYTAGRRQDAQELEDERLHVMKSGADWVATQRGGETTYHGPGQIVGYSLFDLTRMGVSRMTISSPHVLMSFSRFERETMSAKHSCF
jgi:lipoyl(octanoyl) transferase 2